MPGLGRDSESRHSTIQMKAEGADHGNSEDANRRYARQSGHSIVNAGGRSGVILVYRTHDNCGQGCYAHSQSKSKRDESREKATPVAGADRWKREAKKPSGANKRSGDQRQPGPVAAHKSTRPARKQEHQQDEGEGRSSGGSCRVALYLDQIQGKEEKENSKRSIKKERQ